VVVDYLANNEIRQDIVLSVTSENADIAKKDLDSIAKSMKNLTDYTQTNESTNVKQDRTTGRLSHTVRRRYVPAQQLANKELRRFKMEALGTLFGGMALEKMFGKITKAGFELYQVGDLYNTTFGVLMLPVMEILGETIFGVADALMSLPDEAKLALGTTLLLGQGFGMLVSALSQAVLFFNALGQIGGLTGLITAFQEAMTFVGGIKGLAGQTIKATISIVTKLADTALNFFSTSGQFLLSNVKSIVEFVDGKLDSAIAWVFGSSDTGLGKVAKITISIAAAWAIFEVATRALKWIFEAMGESFGKDTDAGKLSFFVASHFGDNAFEFLINSIKAAAVLPLLIALRWDNLDAWKQQFLAMFMSTPGLGQAIGLVSGVAQMASGGKPWWMPFADGGIVTKPTMGLVGEAGPEAIIPLNKFNETMSSNSMVYSPNIEINASVSSDYDVGRLAEELNRYMYQDYKRLRMA